MKLLIDMNLSPLWAEVFQRHGWEAVHWSTVGDPRASDRTIIQVRTQDVTPQHLEGIVTGALRQHATLLEGGVLITIDEAWARARILPLRR